MLSVEVTRRVEKWLTRLSGSLAYQIRYVYLGVARLDGSPYTYYLNRRKQSYSSGVSRYDPPLARNFAGLLLSCRALYIDAAVLLYSANRFVIYYSC